MHHTEWFQLVPEILLLVVSAGSSQCNSCSSASKMGRGQCNGTKSFFFKCGLVHIFWAPPMGGEAWMVPNWWNSKNPLFVAVINFVLVIYGHEIELRGPQCTKWNLTSCTTMKNLQGTFLGKKYLGASLFALLMIDNIKKIVTMFWSQLNNVHFYFTV